MLQLFLLVIIAQAGEDSSMVLHKPTARSYTKNVIICGITGIGLGAGAYYCNNKSDSYYEEYKTAKTMEKTVESWNKVVYYDNLKKILAGGSILFICSAVYLQLKNVHAAKFSSVVPEINIRYTQNNKLIFGVEKRI